MDAMDWTSDSISNAAQVIPPPAVPVDVLTEIFVRALPDNWDGHCAGRVRLPFAQVCRLWRATALEMSTLWTSINVHLGSGSRASPPRCWGDAVVAYIVRSGEAPLHLAIDLSARDFDEDFFQHTPIDDLVRLFWKPWAWEALCAHAHRWESARLEAVPMSAFSVPPRLPFTRLATLTWYFGSMPVAPGHAYEIPTHFFAQSPNLNTVAIGYVAKPLPLVLPSHWRSRRLCIWASSRRGRALVNQFDEEYNPVLEDEELSPTIVPALRAVFGAGPWLRELELCVGSLRLKPSDIPPIMFPALTWLKLLDDACDLACIIIAPQLREAIIEADGSDDDEYWNPIVFSHPLKSFACLLMRPGGCPHLRSLCLSPQRFERVRHLLTCLESVPALEELVLDASDNDDFPHGVLRFEAVQALTRRSDDARSMRLLPSLVALTLDFEVCMVMEFDANEVPDGMPYSPLPLYRAVWRMLASRRMGRMEDGVALRPLRAFSSNSWHLPQGRRAPWPLPEHEYGQVQSLELATTDPVWPSESEAELASVLLEQDTSVGTPMEPDFEHTDEEEM
ncbi:hypothetical protein HDZ31DRAFT_60798 [Schizophyllum fasciatum]